MITIIDYKVGNLGSIVNMLKKLGVKSKLATTMEDINNAEKLILPGVGAFDSGIVNLRNTGLLDTLNKRVLEDKVPVLGICLGAQLMCKKSEEGKEIGLGWFDAEVRKFNFPKESTFKVPHIGWNYTDIAKDSKLFTDMYEDPRFYFVHSYYMKASEKKDILTETAYDFTFTSSLERENIVGVQFHPEKSHKFGMKLLENFVKHY
ncbi:imidazole glycerol phosphate synthase subunit HisH [Pseudofulvibacter geojedonensis]|uniref:Imidazole glycerol phosphate synthase subunit HisH n=1 Tax=Pseudofulvibacter geojedonensis TaxID=1123758 RepID=A0ABW3I411_9FLAO